MIISIAVDPYILIPYRNISSGPGGETGVVSLKTAGYLWMKTMVVFMTLCLFFSCTLKAATGVGTSQKGRIIGCICDSATHQPLKMVSVAVYSAGNSILVVGTLTDREGHFSLSMLGPGEYFVEINNPDFEVKQIRQLVISEYSVKVNLGQILLVRLPQRLPKKSVHKLKINNVETGIACK